MTTHSSVLAWRIPGTGELDGLPSMGLHRVGHDWSDLAAAAVTCHLPSVSHSCHVTWPWVSPGPSISVKSCDGQVQDYQLLHSFPQKSCICDIFLYWVRQDILNCLCVYFRIACVFILLCRLPLDPSLCGQWRLHPLNLHSHTGNNHKRWQVRWLPKLFLRALIAALLLESSVMDSPKRRYHRLFWPYWQCSLILTSRVCVAQPRRWGHY